MTTVEQLRTAIGLAQLADVLGADAAALADLTDVPSGELTSLRHGLADGLTAQHAAVFDAFARASALVPSTLAATITRRVIGPGLAGRIAGSMEVERAVDLLAHFDVPFLADCCRTLAPAAAQRLVPRVGDDVLVATTTELAGRDDHATLGRFVDVLDDRRLAMVLQALASPRHLLLAGAAVDEGPVLDRVVAILPPGRCLAVVRAAPDHPAAAANLLVRTRPASRRRLLAATDPLAHGDVVDLLDRLAAAVRIAPALRAAVRSLPGPELRAAADRLDRDPTIGRALGRLGAAVLEEGAP